MEIKTCEQYVLDQLEQAQAECCWLRGELADSRAKVEALKAKLEKTPIEAAIEEAGRKEIYRRGTGYKTSVDNGGELMGYEDWCIEHAEYACKPCGMGKAEFIAYFEPEFRAEYAELSEKWKGERE